MKTRLLPLALAALFLLSAATLYAKRKGPAPVAPVTHKGVRYEVVHFGKARGLKQNGGLVEAIDIKTKKSLWVHDVYGVNYDPKREGDVQDVFITEMTLEPPNLIITNEKGERYSLHMETRYVAPLPPEKKKK